MEKYALLGLVQAKPGKEAQVEAFLKSAVRTAEAEPGTAAWYAFRLGGGRFGIFDTFSDEAGREAHLSGEIAKALMANAKDLLVADPQIDKLDVLAVKGTK
jgi:quinol monooxygenase YgiN